MSDHSELHETHISIIFLTGDRAVKLKKPVRFPFLDQSTRALREHACRREVELNRRLAPDVYLGVADIIDPDGKVCDHLVVMRRMPDDRRLSTLVREHAVTDADLNALARTLATFHARAQRSPVISEAGRRDALRAAWESGFTEIRPFIGTVLDPGIEAEIEQLVRRYLEGRDAMFESRIARGHIVDGHGDLLAGDVFLLPDGPRVLDCLEFDDELRYGDVLADVTFLAMDLERLGAAELAQRFVASYRELSGENYPVSLEHHYIALRAHIRAKVVCLRGDPESDEEARTLLDIAHTHLQRARVVLTVVGGGPGVGKTTLAAGIADRRGWAMLRSDEVRKDIAGIGHLDRAPAEFRAGIYDDEATTATYAGLLARARVLLEHGVSVVLDASWTDARRRADVAALAVATSSDLVQLRCEAPAEVAAARMAARARRGNDASDATLETARELALRADPWPAATTIDTGGTPGAALEAAVRALPGA